MLSIRLFIVAFAWCLCSTAFAQEKLPKEMVGTATAANMRGGSLVWSITIDSQQPDGSLKGKLSWRGTACSLIDRPFTGTYHDGTLVLTVDSHESRCGLLKMSLKRGGTAEPTFEGSGATPMQARGESSMGSTVTVTLKPR